MRNNAAMLIIGVIIGALAAVFYYGSEGEKAAAAHAARVAEIERESAAYNERVVDGWNGAVNHLRARLADGWRPKIPRSNSVPTSTANDAPSGANGQAADDVSVARRELAACAADKERLIMDGALTTLQLIKLQEWIAGYSLIAGGEK